MQKIQTLHDALSLVPTHWPLVPGVDKWKEGDEFLPTWNFNDIWRKIDGECNRKCCGKKIGKKIVLIPQKYRAARRPIPQSVREAEARWILYNSLATLNPGESGWIFEMNSVSGDDWIGVVKCETNYGLRKFSEDFIAIDAVNALGGDRELFYMLDTGPGALWRWLAENR